ncbi:hypothetical protein THRCLA_09887 [Thraustotheca clavata]|uniref:Cytochrome P450 n=1 Tax=Thraustotheca clavata TaxID=74557 RepID=A0A1V9YTS0_9STRA|nr:hypothetical protein THRCLA_09887 [Thraustotheca clavata]
MINIVSVIVLLCLAGIAYLFPLNKLPGPPHHQAYLLANCEPQRSSVLSWDNKNPYPGIHLKWLKQYGSAYHTHVLGIQRLTIADPDAIKCYGNKCQKLPSAQGSHSLGASFTAGYGVLGTEDPVHASQRKLFNPHFSSAKFREFVDVFEINANKLAEN